MVKKLIHLSSLILLVFSCKPVELNNSKVLTESEKSEVRSTMDQLMMESIDTLASSQNSPEFISGTTKNLKSSGQTSLKLSGGFNNLGDSLRSMLIKAWNQTGLSTCSILKPFFGAKDSMSRRKPYFFVGSSVSGGAGIKGVTGKDIVWDLYNMQASAFNYRGLEGVVGAGAIGVGASTYIGVAFANMPNVESAWSGRFVAGSVSMSLPILADYLSLGGSGFSSATNDIADLKVIGANLSIQASLSVPTTVPASFSGQTAVWYPDQSTNRLISNLLKQSQVPHSSFGRETCSGNCIRFDSYDKKASYRSRATSVLNSIPLLAVGATSPYFPGYSQLALLTYATGIYRDLANTSQACSF